ncbi:hypothetical protein [Anaeroselena agilis]|uniref:Uncharacterized protein n=1 Tax=Anaeroselena agilis TaxID=3063788 RepID=A0ABU3P3X8_9FIRM|nr:hypothetical protein [Selenomonadales bacterium 4137-cl]
MKDSYGKPVHEICVDKTSCRHETSLDKVDGAEPKATFEPTGHLTKDAIRKTYQDRLKSSDNQP